MSSGRLTMASSQTLTLLLALFPVLRDGEKNRRKAKRLVDYEDNLIRKEKAVHVSKAKEKFVHYFASVSKCPAAPWKAEPQHM